MQAMIKRFNQSLMDMMNYINCIFINDLKI